MAYKGGWVLAFDFRRNASRIAEHAKAAEEFLIAAESARDQRHSRAFVDNLFSATELMAKGMLIWQSDRSLLDSKTHRYIKGRFNRQGKLSNVDTRFVDLLNRLGDLRERARYLAGAFALSDAEMNDMLSVAKEMLRVLLETSPKRASVRSPPGLRSRSSAPPTQATRIRRHTRTSSTTCRWRRSRSGRRSAG